MIKLQDTTIHYVRRVARVLSVVLFALWGAFFIEHLSWFTVAGQWPPASVWMLQAAHLFLLAGLLLSLKWEVLGSSLVIACAFVFFSQAAGERFLPFFGVTIFPAILFLVCVGCAGGASPTRMTGKPA